MRDAIMESIQRTCEKIQLKRIPRAVAEILADDIIESISNLNNIKGVFGSIGNVVKYNSLPKMLHRPCPCGSQFKLEKVEFSNKNISCKSGWFLICENLGGCCEVVSMFVKGETPEDAWLAWDQGVIKGDYSIRLKDAAKALVDKLKLVENDPQYTTIWSIAASHGFIYTGPNYAQELKDLKEALERSPLGSRIAIDRSCEKCGKLTRDVLPEVTTCGDCDIQ